jgi:hypothetical protein
LKLKRFSNQDEDNSNMLKALVDLVITPPFMAVKVKWFE